MMPAADALGHVMDAIDVETFFVCRSEQEARELMRGLMAKLGFADGDVVFVEHAGPGARVRGRAYMPSPLDNANAMSGLFGEASEAWQ